MPTPTLILAETEIALVQGLPVEAHLALAAAFLGGLVLWAAGAKVLKPIFALLGVLAGAFVGIIVAGALELGTVGGVGGWLIAMGIGGVIGLVSTLSLLKLAIVFTAAASFALVGASAALVYVQVTGGPANPVEPPPPHTASDAASERTPRDDSGNLLFTDPRTNTLVPIARLLGEPSKADSDDNPDAGTDITLQDVERARVIATRVQAVVQSAADLAARRWRSLGPDQQLAVAGGTLGGIALGLAAGFFLPKRSTAVITALAGSASFLISGVALIDALPWLARLRPLVDHTPLFWAIAWAAVASFGILVQLKLIKKNKGGDSKKSKKDDD